MLKEPLARAKSALSSLAPRFYRFENQKQIMVVALFSFHCAFWWRCCYFVLLFFLVEISSLNVLFWCFFFFEKDKNETQQVFKFFEFF